jgi:hypothetical protein
MAAAESRAHLYWACSALSAFTLLFLGAKVSSSFSILAWICTALIVLATLSLAVLYAACALGRAQLSMTLGRATLFQLSVAPLLIALAAAATLPDHYTGTLALLLPWGISYWLHHLNANEPADRTPDH